MKSITWSGIARYVVVVLVLCVGATGVVRAASAPVAANGTATTTQGVSVSTTLTATGAPGAYLRYILVSHPHNGVLIGKEPNLTYAPNKGFVGTDSFSFKVYDGTAYSSVATYTVTVTGSQQRAAAAATVTSIPFTQGFVSLTFDDGLLNQYQNALPILDAAGLKGSFYIITHTAGMGVPNPGFEVANPASSTQPKGWLTSGTNARFIYPVTGQTGKAVEVSSSVTKSNAAWYFPLVTVLNDENYIYSDSYRSTTTSDIVVQMLTTTGTTQYINQYGNAVSTLTPALTLASTNGAWVTLPSFEFYVPPNIKSVTVLHRLTGKGSLDIDNVSMGAFLDYMTPAQVLQMQTDGQEVGGHTQTHPDLATLSTADQTSEISGGRQELLGYGVTPAETLVYPYGSFNATTEQVLQQAGYVAARTVNPGYDYLNSPIDELVAQSVYSDTTAAQMEGWIDQAVANKQWLILIFHPVETDLTNELYGTTPQIFQTVVSYLKTKNVPVLTMDQGAALIRGRTNTAPVASNSSLTIATNTPSPVVLNATDAEGDPVSYSIVTQPAHGVLTGSLSTRTYTPTTGFTGTDSFTFKANDGLLDSNTASVSITVSSAATSSAQNLILNPSFVTPNPTNSALPLNWSQGGWGTNTHTYTYPVTGKTDTKAAKVQITSYTNGDAKWVPDVTTVIPGHTYTYSDSYISTAPSHLELELIDSSQNATFTNDITVPTSTPGWGVTGMSFTVPAGITSASVIHFISGVGSLTLDNVSLFDGAGTTTTSTTTPPAPPSITMLPSTLLGSTVNAAYAQTLTASTTATGPFTWSVSSGAVPTGLTLRTSTSTQTSISGTTTVAGTYTFAVTVTNGTSSTTKQYTMTVTALAVPSITITPASLPSGTANAAYTQTLTASTTATGPFTWSIASGALPQGLALSTSTSTTATITGTATTTGTANFVVAVTNGTSSTTQSYSITMNSVAIPPITISPTTLPGGTVNQNYSQTLTATTAASGPFTWSIASGALPQGLTLGASTGTTDTITGTTTAAGSSTFSVRVTNGTSSTTQSYTVTVNPAATTTNLVLNPSFVTPDPTNPSSPQYWSQGGWGTNTATFTYPVTGKTDSTAAEVQITAYTDGDKKWVMQGIPVTAGKSYTYTDSYEANVASTVEVEYLSTSGVYSYYGATTAPASASAWGTSTLTFTPPAGTASMRVFHYLTGVGWLTIDDVSVVSN